MKIPQAAYRLQFGPTFGFGDAEALLDYLSNLGVSDIYASPVLRAKKGSSHGYDVVDMHDINPSYGGRGDFTRLVAKVRSRGLGWIQDFVPNHMAFDGENRLLMDIFENGEHSVYYDFFDVNWNHHYESLRGRLLAPFLARPYGETLESGEITLHYDEWGFSINYFDVRFPLRIETYVGIMTHRLHALCAKLSDDNPNYIKYLGILYSLKNLPKGRAEGEQRHHQLQFVKRMLWELYSINAAVRQHIDENVSLYNGGGGGESAMDLLDDLLAGQLFRLSFWKVATEEINYRRFFNINGLISLRVEDEKVFDYSHERLLELVRAGRFTGLRVDHIDGLYDPKAYLERLRGRAGDIYLVTEKILDKDEGLRRDWPVQGTTGYDFLNCLNGLFCDDRNGRRLNRIYYHFTGIRSSYEAIRYEKKKLVIEKHMTGDVDNLAIRLKKLSSMDRQGSDITLYGLKETLVEVLACFPVYRTYISREEFGEADRRAIVEAVAAARVKNPVLIHELNFLERFLVLEGPGAQAGERRAAWVNFIMKFQQLTGPLMAKGFEDTALYIYNRLISLNEVGGSPDTFGTPLEKFHQFQVDRAGVWPHSLSATSTHDTKRGEDVRARINVLSEMPDAWEDALQRWSRVNQKKKKALGGKAVPDKNDGYFLYQTMIGSFPFEEESESYRERLRTYLVKAVREAKLHTAWLTPDTDYEQAFLAFVDEILSPGEVNTFLPDFRKFQRRVAFFGVFNSLSQVLIKITAPGVPEFYQGTELWDLNLVDPDNRRPVDFERAAAYLEEILHESSRDAEALARRLLLTPADGKVKLFLVNRALRARGKNAALFREGEYLPLETAGLRQGNVVAFGRRIDRSWSITAVPRFLSELMSEGDDPCDESHWGDTAVLLPEGAPEQWHDAITGRGITGKGRLELSSLFHAFPAAMLVGSPITTP